jgi:indolepyruvate decarboxylase
LPRALGVPDALTHIVRTCGELDRALADAAAHRDRMVLVEAVLRPDDVPPLLADLARAAAAANSRSG